MDNVVLITTIAVGWMSRLPLWPCFWVAPSPCGTSSTGKASARRESGVEPERSLRVGWETRSSPVRLEVPPLEPIDGPRPRPAPSLRVTADSPRHPRAGDCRRARSRVWSATRARVTQCTAWPARHPPLAPARGLLRAPRRAGGAARRRRRDRRSPRGGSRRHPPDGAVRGHDGAARWSSRRSRSCRWSRSASWCSRSTEPSQATAPSPR